MTQRYFQNGKYHIAIKSTVKTNKIGMVGMVAAIDILRPPC